MKKVGQTISSDLYPPRGTRYVDPKRDPIYTSFDTRNNYDMDNTGNGAHNNHTNNQSTEPQKDKTRPRSPTP